MSDLDQLRELTNHFVPPPYHDLVDLSRKRRRRTVAAATLAAATAATAGIVLATQLSGVNRAEQVPTEPGTPMVNGRIQTTEEFLGRAGVACSSCISHGSVFDQDTGRLLIMESDPDSVAPISGIRVVGGQGLVARLTCPADFSCPTGYAVTSGPGADEFSVARGDRIHVIGFDGALRKRLDLSAALGDQEDAFITGLAWSPDGDRLAVGTAGPSAHRIWLFDRHEAEPRVAYSVSSSERLPRVALTRIAWSPDGSRLGFVEAHWNMAAEFGNPQSAIDESTRAVSLSVSDAVQGAPDAATTLYEYPKPHPVYDDDVQEVFLWSPDGTRVAIRFYDQLLELAADDGTVLAEHPLVGGDLIWPAKQP